MTPTTTRPTLDLLTEPLEGTRLIEASAGTGKTYAIEALFVRLVLEKNFSVDQILVVTYTVAATDELRDRIRTRLREARETIVQGAPPEKKKNDVFLASLAHVQNREQSEKKLAHALRDFDEAAIFTIHSFCQRMLTENAFESGAPFETELITDQSAFLTSTVEDFWRQHAYAAPPLFVNYLIKKRQTPETFIKLGNLLQSSPSVELVPTPGASSDFAFLEKCFMDAFSQASKAWNENTRTSIHALLTDKKALNGNKYRPTSVVKWIAELDGLLQAPPRSPVLFDMFKKFTTDELAACVKKNQTPPEHPFFGVCQSLQDAAKALQESYASRVIELQRSFLEYAKQELPKRKSTHNVMGFDDLLTQMHAALRGAKGDALRQAVRKKFKAALIDEFQDTDPVQYDIFHSLFKEAPHVMFLIGDPKQAIYSFRGADIFAYLKAASQADHVRTLRTNWRSEPGLVRAVNTIFSASAAPFVFEGIPYDHVDTPAIRQDILIENGLTLPQFRLWLAGGQSRETGKALSKTQARQEIIEALAGEMTRLLELSVKGQLTRGGVPVTPGDMAVLVRSHREAKSVSQKLSSLGVPCVVYNSGNLFTTHEAGEVLRVMQAFAAPSNESKLRSALATTLLGLQDVDLDALTTEQSAWDAWVEAFASYGALWTSSGFIAGFGHFLRQEHVRSRLLSLEQGERRLTNVLHLVETLHRQEQEAGMNPSGLASWLARRMENQDDNNEEHQLRLESDEQAVKIVTIHKSKGLEYPIVFCPFFLGEALSKEQHALFHDPTQDNAYMLDLGSDNLPQHKEWEKKEILAENLRLLYVALTRAKNRCYMVWGDIKRTDTAALMYLFHYKGDASSNELIKELAKAGKAVTYEHIETDLLQLAHALPESIEISELPERTGTRYAGLERHETESTCREFTQSIERQWRISSFSSLTSTHAQPETPALAMDVDAIAHNAPTPDPVEPEGIFAFPKGAKPGTMLHALFEHLDFTRQDASQLPKLAQEMLETFGFDAAWHEPVCSMVENVLNVELAPGLRLAHVGNQDKLNELEFYFPLRAITPDSLVRAYRAWGKELDPAIPARTQGLSFAPQKGMLMGFMDLVFRHNGKYYLLDWKSNYLGPDASHYNPKAMAQAMVHADYYLQYHLYCVALDAYLRHRLPGYNYEEHFGGVFYIFLRGVDPAQNPENGIFKDKPQAGFIQELSQTLIDWDQGEDAHV